MSAADKIVVFCPATKWVGQRVGFQINNQIENDANFQPMKDHLFVIDGSDMKVGGQVFVRYGENKNYFGEIRYYYSGFDPYVIIETKPHDLQEVYSIDLRTGNTIFTVTKQFLGFYKDVFTSTCQVEHLGAKNSSNVFDQFDEKKTVEVEDPFKDAIVISPDEKEEDKWWEQYPTVEELLNRENKWRDKNPTAKVLMENLKLIGISCVVKEGERFKEDLIATLPDNKGDNWWDEDYSVEDLIEALALIGITCGEKENEWWKEDELVTD